MPLLFVKPKGLVGAKFLFIFKIFAYGCFTTFFNMLLNSTVCGTKSNNN